MVDFFYFSRRNFILFFDLLGLRKTPRLRRRIFKLFSEFAYYLYLLKLRFFPLKEKGINVAERDKKVIISLTSFPKRINVIWITVNSLLGQTYKPDRIILWLAEEEFENKLDSLPENLLKLQDKGLSIEFCRNLRSHKKYYEAMRNYPNDIVITVDDDIIYPEGLVEELMKLHEKYPDEIICTRGHKITYKNGEVLPYSQWIHNVPLVEVPRIDICPTGVGGVLYPPNSLNKNLFNEAEIRECCFNADDLWLKTMGVLNGTKVVKSRKYQDHFFQVKGTKESSLYNENVIENKNDIQMKAILDKYDIMGCLKE